MILFVVSVLFIFYTYFGYPLLLTALGKARRKGAVNGQPLVLPVCVVIPAYNEEAVIAAKLKQVLQSNYPPDLLRVIVVSDGSSDNTLAEARSIVDKRLLVIDGGVRQGKMATVNFAMSMVTEPIVVMTDAGELLDENTIPRLVARFSDPRVGAVSGDLRMVSMDNSFSKTLGTYWRYEKWIRSAEAELGSVVGVTGPLYAMRRRLYRPLPADTILDDLAIPLEVIAQGYRVGYEHKALAFERATLKVRQEFLRKRRTLAGNVQVLSRYWRLLLPGSRIAWQLWSHKVFRLLVPYALIGVLIGGLMMPPPWAAVVTFAQIIFYGLALATAGRTPHRAWLKIPYTFCVLNWASVAGSYAYLAGRLDGQWEKVK